MDNKGIGEDIDKIKEEIKKIFSSDKTVKIRSFQSNNLKVKCEIIFIEGLSDKRAIYESVIKPVVNCKYDEEVNKQGLMAYMQNTIFCSDFEVISDVNSIIESILEGDAAMFIDGVKEALIINVDQTPERDVMEPSSESSIKGPKDGFNENLITNISLIKKRLQTTQLKLQFKNVGKNVKTRICICYLQDIAPIEIVNEVIKRLDEIESGDVLNDNYLEELIRDEPFTFFKTIGSTDRPDMVCGKLLDGKVAIICNGSPFVLTIPYIFVESFKTAGDYYNNFAISSINRIIRMLSFFITTSLPALYIAFVTYHHELIPTKLFLGILSARAGIPFPTVVEILGMVFVFEILREAGFRLPKQVGQTISIVGALVLGDAAVKARLISTPIVIIVALTGICGFSIIQNVESSIILRIIFIMAASILGLYGYIFAIIALFIHLLNMKSFGVNYLSYSETIGKETVRDAVIRYPFQHRDRKGNFFIKSKVKINNYRRKKWLR